MAKVDPKYGAEFYTTQAIKSYDKPTKEQIDEYKRLGKEMNKRLDALERNFSRSHLLKENEKAPDISTFYDKNGRFNQSDFAKQFNSVYKFVSHPWTTMKGFRKQLSESVKSINELFRYRSKQDPNKWITPRVVTSKTIWNLYDFLDEYYQEHKEQKVPKSEEVVDIYVEAVRLNMDLKSLAKNMDYWKEHYQEMQKLQPIESKKPVSSDEYEKLI